MVTIRLNVVAFILAGLVAFMFALILHEIGYTYADMAKIAVPVVVVVKVYEGIAGLNAFKGGNKNKDGKK